jgi:hypothetical protein
MINHNVETCRKKKEQITMAATEAAQPNQKPQKTSSYVCHICWFEWTKNDRLSKVYEMQKMFHEKFVIVVEVQPIVETQIVTTYVNVVDVNLITRCKATEK